MQVDTVPDIASKLAVLYHAMTYKCSLVLLRIVLGLYPTRVRVLSNFLRQALFKYRPYLPSSKLHTYIYVQTNQNLA